MTPRPFLLSVDSGSYEEPGNRYFGSLEAAIAAMNEYPEHFRAFAWIGESVAGSRVSVVHVRDGERVSRHDPENYWDEQP